MCSFLCVMNSTSQKGAGAEGALGAAGRSCPAAAPQPRRGAAAMHGTWTLSWHAVMLTLLLHVVLYALVFLVCAFFAARQFRRMRNPVPPPEP